MSSVLIFVTFGRVLECQKLEKWGYMLVLEVERFGYTGFWCIMVFCKIMYYEMYS